MAQEARRPRTGRKIRSGQRLATMAFAVALPCIAIPCEGLADEARSAYSLFSADSAQKPVAHAACADCHGTPAARPPGSPTAWSENSTVCLRCHQESSGPGHTYVNGHAISVPYPTLDPGFEPSSRVVDAGLRLPGGRVECVTCHDVHAAGLPGRVRVSLDNSHLCLTCHRK